MVTIAHYLVWYHRTVQTIRLSIEVKHHCVSEELIACKDRNQAYN
jgi:hypothetical protein